jgi:hypothetical protein
LLLQVLFLNVCDTEAAEISASNNLTLSAAISLRSQLNMILGIIGIVASALPDLFPRLSGGQM